MAKRSVMIDGHRTSVSVEAPFWDAVREIAANQKRPVAELLTEIDHSRRSGGNLSSAIRTYVLSWYRRRDGKAR